MIAFNAKTMACWMILMAINVVSLPVLPPRGLLGASDFTLNTLNTTAFGPPWSDTYLSLESDWVACEGEYANCYYSNCSANQASSAWAPGVSTASCPCEKHSGVNLVMINAILDEHTWRATRMACPLGLLSCPKPNEAPVCSAINNGSLFNNAPGLSASTHKLQGIGTIGLSAIAWAPSRTPWTGVSSN